MNRLGLHLLLVPVEAELQPDVILIDRSAADAPRRLVERPQPLLGESRGGQIDRQQGCQEPTQGGSCRGAQGRSHKSSIVKGLDSVAMGFASFSRIRSRPCRQKRPALGWSQAALVLLH